nr:MAG TPA: hypothetical protein [Caudoviricetes sp.]
MILDNKLTLLGRGGGVLESSALLDWADDAQW